MNAIICTCYKSNFLNQDFFINSKAILPNFQSQISKLKGGNAYRSFKYQNRLRF